MWALKATEFTLQNWNVHLQAPWASALILAFLKLKTLCPYPALPSSLRLFSTGPPPSTSLCWPTSTQLKPGGQQCWGLPTTAVRRTQLGWLGWSTQSTFCAPTPLSCSVRQDCGGRGDTQRNSIDLCKTQSVLVAMSRSPIVIWIL